MHCPINWYGIYYIFIGMHGTQLYLFFITVFVHLFIDWQSWLPYLPFLHLFLRLTVVLPAQSKTRSISCQWQQGTGGAVCLEETTGWKLQQHSVVFNGEKKLLCESKFPFISGTVLQSKWTIFSMNLEHERLAQTDRCGLSLVFLGNASLLQVYPFAFTWLIYWQS